MALVTDGPELPPGSSHEQRAAEAVMLAALGKQLGLELRLRLVDHPAGPHVLIDGADDALTILVECWAHQACAAANLPRSTSHLVPGHQRVSAGGQRPLTTSTTRGLDATHTPIHRCHRRRNQGCAAVGPGVGWAEPLSRMYIGGGRQAFEHLGTSRPSPASMAAAAWPQRWGDCPDGCGRHLGQAAR